MSSFGDTLKSLRNEKNLTQEELSNILNISRSSIASYETNRKQPDHSKLKIFSDFFNVSIDYLLGRTNKRNYDTSTLAFSVDSRIDTEGLSDEDIAIVQATIDAIRKNRKKND